MFLIAPFSSLYSFSLSPACRVSLETHVQRANYQVFIAAQFQNVPSHAWHSWKVDDDGSLILSGLDVKLYNRN